MAIKNFLKLDNEYYTGDYCDNLWEDHLIENPIHNG